MPARNYRNQVRDRNNSILKRVTNQIDFDQIIFKSLFILVLLVKYKITYFNIKLVPIEVRFADF